MSGRWLKISILIVAIIIIAYLNRADVSVNNDFTKANKISTQEKNSISEQIPAISTTKEQQALLQNATDKKAITEHSNKVKDKQIGTFDCLPIKSLLDEPNLEEIKNHFNSYKNNINNSNPLLYSLFAKPASGESRLDLLFNYYNNEPYHPVVTLELISSCIKSEDERCNADFVYQAIAKDSNNGAIWYAAISYFAENHNDDAVLNAIDSLEKTSIFNERYGEKVLLYTDAMAGFTGTSFGMNAVLGIGESFSIIPWARPVTNWCKANSLDQLRNDACLVLGRQIEKRANTLLSQFIGIALQGIAYNAIGNISAANETDKRRDSLTQSTKKFSSQAVDIMLLLDERLMRSYLTNLDQYGEVQAQLKTVEDASNLYEENENYVCTLVYELLEQFN